MKKIATGAVFVALVVASLAPAGAATSRPKAATVDAASLAVTAPVSFATATPTSVSNDAAATVPVYTSLNQGLLAYFRADLDFQGGVYQSLVDANIATAGLSASYAKLNASILGLIAYLQTTVSNG